MNSKCSLGNKCRYLHQKSVKKIEKAIEKKIDSETSISKESTKSECKVEKNDLDLWTNQGLDTDFLKSLKTVKIEK